MMAAKKWIIRLAAGATLFAAGIGAGTWHERSVEAQNRLGSQKRSFTWWSINSSRSHLKTTKNKC